MRISAILSLAFIGLVSAALPKANEYKSDDCSGRLNYGHRSYELTDVTMDDTTNSVYIGKGHRWAGFDGKTRDGGECTGEYVSHMGTGCNNLHRRGKKIRCVRRIKGLP